MSQVGASIFLAWRAFFFVGLVLLSAPSLAQAQAQIRAQGSEAEGSREQYNARNDAEELLHFFALAQLREISQASPRLEVLETLNTQFLEAADAYRRNGGSWALDRDSRMRGWRESIETSLNRLREDAKKSQVKPPDYGSSSDQKCIQTISEEIAKIEPGSSFHNVSSINRGAYQSSEVLTERGFPRDRQHPLNMPLESMSLRRGGVSKLVRFERSPHHIDVYYQGDRIAGYSVSNDDSKRANRWILFGGDCSISHVTVQDGIITHHTADSCRALPSMANLIAEMDPEDTFDYYYHCREQGGFRPANKNACFCKKGGGGRERLLDNPYFGSCYSERKESTVTPRNKIDRIVRSMGGVMAVITEKTYQDSLAACATYADKLSPPKRGPGGPPRRSGQAIN